MFEQRKKILLFPLANVLGHLSRTLALSEQLCQEGQDVYLAVSDDYTHLLDFLDARIQVFPAIEMFSDATKTFGEIAYNQLTNVNEAELLEASTQLNEFELKRRGLRLKEIIQRDGEIIEKVQPDAIVLDYHYAPLLIEKVQEIPIFFISHAIGYPTLCKRINGSFPYPLNQHEVLVPGISAFENLENGNNSGELESFGHICGMFSWKGWKKLKTSVEKNDIFLFFGSTGSSEQLTPWLKSKLSGRYSLSYVPLDEENPFINLQSYLEATSVVICHGGHGTVMKCIKEATPMIIIPNNLEQLEIGRRVQELKLGVLIAQPYASIDLDLLTEKVDFLQKDQEIKRSLALFAKKLSLSNGTKVAADFIIGKLSEIEEEHKKETTRMGQS